MSEPVRVSFAPPSAIGGAAKPLRSPCLLAGCFSDNILFFQITFAYKIPPPGNIISMKIITEIKTAVQNFLKCGVTGWCLEVMFTSVESIAAGDWRLMGKTSLLMFPIYGLGALLGPIGKGVDGWLGDGGGRTDDPGMLPARDRAIRHGMIYMVLIFAVEYASGMWLRSHGMCPWDYSGRHSNINGLIRLDFAPLWFGTGLLFEQITKKKGG